MRPFAFKSFYPFRALAVDLRVDVRRLEVGIRYHPLIGLTLTLGMLSVTFRWGTNR